MNDKRCGNCKFWARTGPPPAERRGPVVLAAAAQGQQEPVPGQCRRELRSGFILLPVVAPDGQQGVKVECAAGYPPCPDQYPACGEFRAAAPVNGELAQ